MALKPGDKAPDFTLYDSDKNKVSLSEQLGNKILLLFFPFAFSRVCTEELCSVRDNISLYNEMNARVIAISVDSIYTLDKFKKEQKLNFLLLSDFNKEVSRSYEAFYETFSYDMRGVSKRAAFIIDKEGIIQYAEVLENAGNQPNISWIRQIMEGIT